MRDLGWTKWHLDVYPFCPFDNDPLFILARDVGNDAINNRSLGHTLIPSKHDKIMAYE